MIYVIEKNGEYLGVYKYYSEGFSEETPSFYCEATDFFDFSQFLEPDTTYHLIMFNRISIARKRAEELGANLKPLSEVPEFQKL